MERMAMTYAYALALALLGAAALCAQEAQAPAGRDKVNSFYFGNSLTGCTNPQWHEDLGKSAGVEWKTDICAGAGWQLWQHREVLNPDGLKLSPGPRGDLTIDPEFLEDVDRKGKAFYEGDWDAIVLQVFSGQLHRVVTEMWGRKFDKPTDVGAVAAAGDIIDIFLKLNPEGRVYVYQNWPPMSQGRVPPDDQLPEWARVMKERRGEIRRAEFPDREAFDYRTEWLVKKYSPDHPDKPWLDNGRCRDLHMQVFEGLKERFPKLWEEGRLRMIPVGDVFMALEEKMAAGKVPGITSVKDYYTDVQHTRAGLPRYTGAASFYALLFERHPGKLDWSLYNDREKYGEDPHHDKGELLEITEERAKIVNDTIWEVVTNHPYTKLGDAAGE